MAQSKDSALGTYIQAVLGSSLKGHTGWLPKSVLIPPQCLSSVKKPNCPIAWKLWNLANLICWFQYSVCVWGDLYINERWGCRRYRTPRDNMCLLSHNLSYVGSALKPLEREVVDSLGYTCVPAFSDCQREFVWGKCILYLMVYKDCSYPCPGSHVLQYRGVIHLSHWWPPHSVLLCRYRAVISPHSFIVAFLQLHLNCCTITLKLLFSSGYITFLDSNKLAYFSWLTPRELKCTHTPTHRCLSINKIKQTAKSELTFFLQHLQQLSFPQLKTPRASGN